MHSYNQTQQYIIVIMQDDEGFVNQGKSQLIDYDYTAVKVGNVRQKSYVNRLKLVGHFVHFQHSAFMNYEFRQYISSSFINKNKDSLIVNNFNRMPPKLDPDIVFYANFQSGNMQFVLKKRPNQYQVFMKPDTNTNTHYQWFYFKIKNKNKRTIKITIKKFIKSSMLYACGLKPYYRSKRQKKQNYAQISSNVTFYEEEDDQKSFSLSFEYKFDYEYDEIQICSQPPYTYSKMQNYINSKQLLSFQLAKSMMGHRIEAILINQHKNCKALVIVIARQHPGESVGSWMMEGFLNQMKQFAKKQVAWLIVPMLNVDGVILGNNRTGLLGLDFNRNWNVDQDNQKYQFFPQIMGLVRYLKQNKKMLDKKVKFFLDFHGHSSQQNVFSYGPPHLKNSQYYEHSRLFPFMISKKNPNFSYEQCSFQISQSKKYCSRSTIFHKFGFPFSYTIQSSFGLYRDNKINQKQLLEMGSNICEVVVQFIEMITGKKEDKKIRGLIKQMKLHQQLCEPNAEQYDSENHDSDEQKPIRKEFEKRISNILANPKFYNLELKKIQCKLLESIRDRKNQLSQFRKRYQNNQTDTHINVRQLPIQRKRIRTQIPKKIYCSTSSKRSLYQLPKIVNIRSSEFVSFLHKRTKTEANLDSMNMQQIKQRLLVLRNSKLGSKILILNAFSINN